jgi:1,4-alpha-glucan branching enzyme
MYTPPGTKLMFMGSEFAQSFEWNHDLQLEWHLMQYPLHRGVSACIKSLNRLYQSEPALYQKSFEPAGFEWIDMGDSKNSILVYMRKGNNEKENLLIVANFTPQAHMEYQVGVYGASRWKEVFNSNASEYGGTDTHRNDTVERLNEKKHGKDYSLKIQVPTLAVTVLKGA